MAEKNDSSVGVLGGVAVMLGLCCGLPVLLASGIAIGVGGFAVGSGVLIAIGIAVAVWALRRRRRNATSCETNVPSDTTDDLETDRFSSREN